MNGSAPTGLALALLLGCSPSLDCRAYSLRMYEVWGEQPEKTEAECSLSEVHGPFLLYKAQRVKYNLELKGLCRVPGPSLMPDYMSSRAIKDAEPDSWYVFCPN